MERSSGVQNAMTTVAAALVAVICLTASEVHSGSDPHPSPLPVASPAAAPLDAPKLIRTVLLSNLSSPWDLAFTPENAMLFTERCRGLSVLRPNGAVHRLFGAAGSAVAADDLFCQGQSGMLGVAVDPEFSSNRWIYVYMASNLDSRKANRVVRLTVDAGYTRVGDRRDIVTDIPYKISANFWGGAGVHSGGRVRFSPLDGYLHVTTGDNHHGPLPQDLAHLGGKVLRIDRHGRAATGNNTPAGGDPRIFTYGHRNVQGVSFHPSTGQPFISEHGPRHNDEVTPLVAGGNGGWDPRPEAGVSCLSHYCGYTSNKRDGTPTPMTDQAKFPQALRPSWTNEGKSEGLGPCVFLSGPHWQAWEGRMAVGFLRGERIVILKMNAEGMTTETAVVPDLPAERMRSLVQGPDKALYVAVDSGEIWRLAAAPRP